MIDLAINELNDAIAWLELRVQEDSADECQIGEIEEAARRLSELASEASVV